MATEPQTSDEVLLGLRVRGLTRRYWVRNGAWRPLSPLLAVNDVSFAIPPGKTLALVGRSGSGKSTAARCVMRFEKPDTGEIWVGETNIASLGTKALAPFRTKIQMIFQDPATSMNPRMSAADIIEEPLLIQRRGSRTERRDRVAQLMQEVHVSPDWMDRRAGEFSGGQRQRLALARALALEPKLLVLDEALTGLDLSTQARIANLLFELQAARSLTYLLISHDLGLVVRMADLIAVMSGGKIVEQGSTSQVITQPEHPKTRALLAASKHFRATHAAAQGGAQ
jgi:ABC-type glutathione transport system ATPase component